MQSPSQEFISYVRAQRKQDWFSVSKTWGMNILRSANQMLIAIPMLAFWVTVYFYFVGGISVTEVTPEMVKNYLWSMVLLMIFTFFFLYSVKTVLAFTKGKFHDTIDYALVALSAAMLTFAI